MRRFLAMALLTLSACGWQAAGSTNPAIFSGTIAVSVGQTTTVALPPLSSGEMRAATSSAPSVASAKIDAHQDLEVTGASSGTATVIQTDSSGGVVMTIRTYRVIVTP